MSHQPLTSRLPCWALYTTWGLSCRMLPYSSRKWAVLGFTIDIQHFCLILSNHHPKVTWLKQAQNQFCTQLQSLPCGLRAPK